MNAHDFARDLFGYLGLTGPTDAQMNAAGYTGKYTPTP
jgi:hypothetical protein